MTYFRIEAFVRVEGVYPEAVAAAAEGVLEPWFDVVAVTANEVSLTEGV